MRCSRSLAKLAALAAIGALTAMSGCGADHGAGQPAGVTEPAPAGGSGSATAGTANPGSEVSDPQPAGGSGAPVPIAKGQVSVRLDAGEYHEGAVIHVAVTNKTDRPVYTEDFKTSCS